MTESDPWDDPETQRWLNDVLTDMVPKMESSAVVFSLVPKTEWDLKYCVELGAAIMMDKPIVSVVHLGTKISAKLAQVSDRIIEIDLDAPGATKRMQSQLMPVLRELLDEQKKGERP